MITYYCGKVLDIDDQTAQEIEDAYLLLSEGAKFYLNQYLLNFVERKQEAKKLVTENAAAGEELLEFLEADYFAFWSRFESDMPLAEPDAILALTIKH